MHRAPSPVRLIAGALVTVLPWPLKRRLLAALWGYTLAPTSRIGLSWIFPEHLELAAGARIGHLNVAINLRSVRCGPNAVIGRSNWITGHPPGGPFFGHRTGRDPSLHLGESAAIVKSHLVDCSDRVEIGDFTVVAGYRTQIVTHGIDIDSGLQDCRPVTVGRYCMIGTRAILLPGSALPDRSVLAAGSTLTRPVTEPGSLYAGQPARLIKPLAPDAAYFTRTS